MAGPANATRPSAAARMCVPIGAAKSTPVCSLYSPVTGWTRIPKPLVRTHVPAGSGKTTRAVSGSVPSTVETDRRRREALCLRSPGLSNAPRPEQQARWREEQRDQSEGGDLDHRSVQGLVEHRQSEQVALGVRRPADDEDGESDAVLGGDRLAFPDPGAVPRAVDRQSSCARQQLVACLRLGVGPLASACSPSRW